MVIIVQIFILDFTKLNLFIEGKFYDSFYKHNLPNKSNINKCHF
jgi:hypothetical protein